jgi:hypothetical protein
MAHLNYLGSDITYTIFRRQTMQYLRNKSKYKNKERTHLKFYIKVAVLPTSLCVMNLGQSQQETKYNIIIGGKIV